MRLRWAILILAAVTAPSFVDRAYAGTSPIKAVEHLSYLRESATEKGTQFKLLTVKCAATRQAYIYLCNFQGLAGRRPLCAATYVHYHPRHTGHYRVNFWGQAWPCGSKPPVAPPVYPEGPSS